MIDFYQLENYAMMETSKCWNVLQRVWDGGSQVDPSMPKIPPEFQLERVTSLVD